MLLVQVKHYRTEPKHLLLATELEVFGGEPGTLQRQMEAETISSDGLRLTVIREVLHAWRRRGDEQESPALSCLLLFLSCRCLSWLREEGRTEVCSQLSWATRETCKLRGGRGLCVLAPAGFRAVLSTLAQNAGKANGSSRLRRLWALLTLYVWLLDWVCGEHPFFFCLAVSLSLSAIRGAAQCSALASRLRVSVLYTSPPLCNFHWTGMPTPPNHHLWLGPPGVRTPSSLRIWYVTASGLLAALRTGWGSVPELTVSSVAELCSIHVEQDECETSLETSKSWVSPGTRGGLLGTLGLPSTLTWQKQWAWDS